MNRQERAELRDRAIARFRELKADENWTQDTLVQETGLPLRTVSDFIRQVSVPNQDTLLRICRALGVEPDALAARDAWPSDVQGFLDIFGMYLAARKPEQRRIVMQEIITQFVAAGDD